MAVFFAKNFSIAVNGKGFTTAFSLKNGENILAAETPFAFTEMGGRRYMPVSAAAKDDGSLLITFENGENAVFSVRAEDECIIFSVAECENAEKLSFCNIETTHRSGFHTAGMALNLKTNGNGVIGVSQKLCAYGYKRFGIKGCSYAVVGAEKDGFREALKAVTVKYTEDIPYLRNAGAFAVEHEDSRRSYLMNVTGITEETTDEWIKFAHDFGFTQIDFHGGNTFRFGDCVPNAGMFPEGRKTLSRIIDRLHEAGIQAGLHTYAQFIDKKSEFVSPVPSRDLAVSEIFTLDENIDENAKSFTVCESTDCISCVTGFAVRNSTDFIIDDEIITFSGKGANGFTGCGRGAYGTKPSAHKKGAAVKHLKSIFGLFAADGDSPLYTEVAKKTAEFFNDCGFDFFYFDAIDGSDIFAGGEFSWYYSANFVADICRNLKKQPAGIEMSAFWHHFWYFRTRLGAWDHPRRAHKEFLGAHNKSNLNMRETTLLPQNLGWWVFFHENLCQSDRMYSDDIERYASYAYENDWSLSLIFSPDNYRNNDEEKRFAEIIRRYEEKRLSRKNGESVNVPDGELKMLPDGSLRCVKYKSVTLKADGSHKELALPESSETVLLRVENSGAVGKTDGKTLIAQSDYNTLRLISSKNVESSMSLSDSERPAVRLTAKQNGEIGYTRFEKKYEPCLSAKGKEGLGVWIYGDGKKEILNIQMKSPRPTGSGFCDRLIDIDFTGWKYFSLYKNDAARMGENVWPFSGGGHYNDSEKTEIFNIDKTETSQYEWSDSLTEAGLYEESRENMNFGNIESVSVWMNNMKDGVDYEVLVGEIIAYPISFTELKNTVISFGNSEIRLNGTIPVSGYAENDCGRWYAYDKDGKTIESLAFDGDIPGKISSVSATSEDPTAVLRLTVGYLT